VRSGEQARRRARRSLLLSRACGTHQLVELSGGHPPQLGPGGKPGPELGRGNPHANNFGRSRPEERRSEQHEPSDSPARTPRPFSEVVVGVDRHRSYFHCRTGEFNPARAKGLVPMHFPGPREP
jgi:hypothetical protein